jgi:hypothetical protein
MARQPGFGRGFEQEIGLAQFVRKHGLDQLLARAGRMGGEVPAFAELHGVDVEHQQRRRRRGQGGGVGAIRPRKSTGGRSAG